MRKVMVLAVIMLCGMLVSPELWVKSKAQASHMRLQPPSTEGMSLIRGRSAFPCQVVGDEVNTTSVTNTVKKDSRTEVETITTITTVKQARFPRMVWIEGEKWDPGAGVPGYLHLYFVGGSTRPFAAYEDMSEDGPFVYVDANRDGHWDAIGRPFTKPIGSNPCDTLKAIWQGKIKAVRHDLQRKS